MAKQRKTREEKIATRLKQQQNPFTYSFVTPTVTPIKQSPAIDGYDYVLHDIQKTAIVSSTLLVLLLVSFFLLQHRVIVIPGVTY